MRSRVPASAMTVLAALCCFGCTPFLGPLPDAGRDEPLEDGSPRSDSTHEDQNDALSEATSQRADVSDELDAQSTPGTDAPGELAASTDAASTVDGSAETNAADSGIETGTQLPVPGALVHLEADYGLVTSGGTVSKWRDQSGGGLDATETDPGFQPAYLDDFNAGSGAIVFGITPGQDLYLPDGFTNLQNGVSLFFVVGVQQATGVDVLLKMNPNGPTVTVVTDTSTDVVNVDFYVGAGTTSGGRAFGFAYDAWHLIEVVQQGGAAGAAAMFTVYLDGSALVSANQPVPSAELKDASLGPAIEDGTFELQAAIVYGRAVTNDERTKIERYLTAKWQLAP